MKSQRRTWWSARERLRPGPTNPVEDPESVSRWVKPGPEALTYILSVSRLPNVCLQAVPFSTTHVGLEVGLFVLLEFPEQRNAWTSEPPVVYVQGYTSDQYLERPEEIARYRDAASRIKQSALGEHETRDLVLKIAEEHDEQR